LNSGVRLATRAWRAHDPRWSFDPVSGTGAAIRGGRFNAKGTSALYLSLDPITALAECTQGFSQRMLPLTLCEYDVDVEAVADLSGDSGCAALDIDPADLACPWLLQQLSGKPVPSQRLAKRLVADGYAGAIAPSFVPNISTGAANLVLWRWDATLPCRVLVHDPKSRLPRDQSSWPT
jgi:RES domain-containing protein